MNPTHMHRWITTVLCAALFAWAPVARAQAPRTISFQGVLTDDQGTPLDGSYNLTFKLYTANPFLGLPNWQEVQNGVTVTNGFFAVELGTVSPVDLVFTQPYFLGISVNGGAELTPRTPLTSAPYALGLKIPFGASVTDASSAFFIRNNGTGAAMEAVGLMKVGSSSSISGTLDLYQSGVSTPVVELSTEAPHGGRVRTFDEAGNMFGALEPDIDGSGGEFEVRRGPGQVGFQVDGNWSGTGDPLVKVQGASRSVTLNMNSSGNGSVQLPADAISAGEILDEPGVANNWDSGSVLISADATKDLVSETMTAPAAGYVIAFGTTRIANAYLSLSDESMNPKSPLLYVTDSDHAAIQSVFQVSAGVHTFHLIAVNAQSSMNGASSPNLVLIYVPTARGPVKVGH